jgi:hypothetical protein
MHARGSLTLLALWPILLAGTSPLAAAEQDGVALAVVYDTSGSMRDPVKDKAGKETSKYLVANRALLGVTSQLEAFLSASNAASPRVCHAALFVFQGEDARQAVPFGPFNPAAFQDFARRFSSPNGNTPLGKALEAAAKTVLQSPFPRKHVLVITDGINTAGPEPATVLARLQSQPQTKQTPFAVHLVAFDVDAKVFVPLKRLGATVVAASDERQLDSQLEFILQKKILLEEEEPGK